MSSQSQQPLNWLLQQFQLKPGKPDIAASLQTLVLVLVPIGVGVLMGHPAASAIAVMGAWSVGLVNVEGAYRHQATAKIAATISIIAMLFLANLVDGTLWLSALTTFLVMFIAGFVSLFGQAASSISLTSSIMFIVALAKFAAFPDWSTVLQQCALCLGGGNVVNRGFSGTMGTAPLRPCSSIRRQLLWHLESIGCIGAIFVRGCDLVILPCGFVTQGR
jgi:hypothetical protein